ncbi:sn-glycerol-3-phosphate ABC transporter ATP-binding protein UgpC [Ahrensia kielensis]|uniref:Sn-glycerol-3-phosphate ABC transporter ATP-binding protein UgpC n=1 Tax=Ahrensia kielensis TaxID=76980 RepID=A0ABU9T2B3_9HYPH
MANVTIDAVQKQYGGVQALHNVNIKVGDGEFVALVGPSGCGKSTLLRMIAGLETITGGDIIINDRVVNDLAPKERDVAMVFQSYALYPHLTVAQNMGFSMRIKRLPKAEIAQHVQRAASILSLENLLDRYPKQLSGGQRQRVAMGRAIVRDPAVFLFDEPLSNLDAKLRAEMRGEIKELHQRLKTTMIYVTHDQIEAMTMADRIVVMNAGRIEQIGTPLELYDAPANTFVAGFIGMPTMNFFEGVAVSGGVRIADVTMPCALPQIDVGTKLKIGVRPEHFEIGEEGLDGRVVVVEPTGLDTHLTVDVAGEQVTVLTRDRNAYEPSDSIRLTLSPTGMLCFNPENGKLI